MKIKVINLLVLMLSLFATAQENIKICQENQSKIDVIIKNNNFDDANKLWQVVNKSCKSIAENTFLNAEKINLYFIDKALSNSDSALDLIKIYTNYDLKFPENKNNNAIKKAILLFDSKSGTNQAIFETLEPIYKNKFSEFNNPKALYLYIYAFNELNKTKTQGFKPENILDKFLIINKKFEDLKLNLDLKLDKISKSENKTADDLQQSTTIIDDLYALQTYKKASQAIAEPYLRKANLENYCNNNFEEFKNNASWLQFFANQMFEKNTTSTPIFAKIVNQAHIINPNSKSNFYLGYLSILKNDDENYNKYFDDAVANEPNLIEKSFLSFEIANLVYAKNNKEVAMKFLKIAIENNPQFGKPYLLIAQILESSIDDCAKTAFDKKAFYWLLSKTIEKAAVAEKYLLASTKKQSEKYLLQIPTRQEIDNSGLAGKTITFNCLINETITVPSK